MPTWFARAFPRRELPSGVPDPERDPRVAPKGGKGRYPLGPRLAVRTPGPLPSPERKSGTPWETEPNGADLPPGLGPLTFLLRKMLPASKSRPSPGTQNSWHLRPGPPRPEEAPWSGRGTMGHCAARGLPDRKPGPAEPSDSDPAALGPHV